MSGLLRQMRDDFTGDRVSLVMAGFCVLLPVLLFAHSIADIAISLVAIAFLVQSVRRKDFAWVRQRWVQIALVFWAYIVMRGLLSNHVEDSAGHAAVWIRFIVFAAALQALAVRSEAVLALMLRVFVAATLFGAADTLFQFAVGHDIFGKPWFNDRLTGPLGSAAIGNLLLFAGLPLLALLFTWLREPLNKKVLAVAGVFFISLAIFLTGERMSVILLGAALLVCLLFVARASWRVNVALIGLALMGTALIYAIFPQVLARHLSAVAVFTAPQHDMYLFIWQAALDVFKANPIFGVGMHTFRLECATYAAPNVVEACRSFHPHNLWLELLAETGVVGTAILLGFFVVALKPAVRLWRAWSVEPLLAGAAIATLLRLWPIASTRSFFVNQNEVLFWTLLAVAVAAATSYMSRTPDKIS